MSFSVLAVSFAVLTSFCAPAMAERAQLVTSPFDENVREASNTGGARVAGVQWVGTQAQADLKARVPGGWAGSEICVRTGTSDGLYDTQNTYDLPTNAPALVDIPHVEHSSYAKRLKELDPQGYGIRILHGRCDAVSRTSPSTLANWRDGGATDRFWVLVNSFDATRLVAVMPDGAEIECEKVSADIQKAFDRVCELPIPNTAKELEIELVPIKDQRLLRSEFLTVVLR